MKVTLNAFTARGYQALALTLPKVKPLRGLKDADCNLWDKLGCLQC